MIPMTKMENIVMNLTGCQRQIANTVVNAILEEDMRSNAEEEVVYRIYWRNNKTGEYHKGNEVFTSEFDASQRCFELNDKALDSIFGQYIYREERK
jgi:hypothetical protein